MVWAYIFKVIDTSADIIYQQHLKGVFDVTVDILQLLCSEVYCYYYLDFMIIAYYLETNCLNQFPKNCNVGIYNLTGIGTCEMTRLFKGQMNRLYCQLCIPEELRYRLRCTFTGEIVFTVYGFQQSW